MKWNGTAWTAQTSGSTQYLYGVWGTDANNIWAVGLSGAIQKWDGKTWTAQSSGTSSYLHGVWGTDANNVWVVGWGGTIGSRTFFGPSVEVL